MGSRWYYAAVNKEMAEGKLPKSLLSRCMEVSCSVCERPAMVVKDTFEQTIESAKNHGTEVKVICSLCVHAKVQMEN